MRYDIVIVAHSPPESKRIRSEDQAELGEVIRQKRNFLFFQKSSLYKLVELILHMAWPPCSTIYNIYNVGMLS